MLPPEITTTVRRPRTALATSSSAATARAADRELAHQRDVGEVIARHREGALADRAFQSLGQRRRAGVRRIGATLVERAAHRAVRFRRHAEDLDPARHDLDADAAREATAADRHHDRLHVGELGQDLTREQAAVARDHVVVVERRDELQAGIGGGAAAGLGLGFVVGGARDFDGGTQRGDTGALDLRSLSRHQHRRLQAERLRGECHAQPVVAGRGGDDPLGDVDLGTLGGFRTSRLRPTRFAPVERERRQPSRRAAHLERSGALQVLELEPDVGARAPAQHCRGHERRDTREAADAFAHGSAGDLTPDFGIEHAHESTPTYHGP
jgi:hypothetical protein